MSVQRKGSSWSARRNTVRDMGEKDPAWRHVYYIDGLTDCAQMYIHTMVRIYVRIRADQLDFFNCVDISC